mgnify:CR=1 FL=1
MKWDLYDNHGHVNEGMAIVNISVRMNKKRAHSKFKIVSIVLKWLDAARTIPKQTLWGKHLCQTDLQIRKLACVSAFLTFENNLIRKVY